MARFHTDHTTQHKDKERMGRSCSSAFFDLQKDESKSHRSESRTTSVSKSSSREDQRVTQLMGELLFIALVVPKLRSFVFCCQKRKTAFFFFFLLCSSDLRCPSDCSFVRVEFFRCLPGACSRSSFRGHHSLIGDTCRGLGVC